MAVVPAAVGAPSRAAVGAALRAEAPVPATSPGATGPARHLPSFGGATEENLLDGEALAAIGGRAAPPEVAPAFPTTGRGGGAVAATARAELRDAVPETVAFLTAPAGGVAAPARWVSEVALDPPEAGVEVQAGTLAFSRIATVATDVVQTVGATDAGAEIGVVVAALAGRASAPVVARRKGADGALPIGREGPRLGPSEPAKGGVA